jgi:hypothetical protein
VSEQEFLAAITGHPDDLRLALEALRASGQPFCLIGGLAVNHYVEPVVTLDADFAVAAAGAVAPALRERGFVVEEQPHSINARLPGSRLRLQITVNSRYAAFPRRAVPGQVLGHELPVACLEDLVRGKVWALADPARRPSKRAKDEADLVRLAEAHPEVLTWIPPGLAPRVDALRTTAPEQSGAG